MTNGLKILLLAAGTIVTVIACIMAFSMVHRGKDSMAIAVELTTACDYSQLKEYDGRLLEGCIVIQILEEYAKEKLSMRVKTRQCVAALGVYYNYDANQTAIGTYDATKCKWSDDYINEYGVFQCTVETNLNGMVTGLSFIQR